MTEQQLFLGLDGGGSRCRAVLMNSEGRVLGAGEAGSAHPANGERAMAEAIVTATDGALLAAERRDFPKTSLLAVAGLAGLHLPRFGRIAAQWSHPFAQLHLVTDLDIACYGAHGGADGGVIIMGTGVSAYARAGGQALAVAGHGFPHSGKGGGHWLGYEAVTAVLAAADNLGPNTILSPAALQLLGVNTATELANHFYQAPASEYGRLAPLVFNAAEQGDGVALYLRQQALDYLQAIARQFLRAEVSRLVLVGGVAEALTPLLAEDVRAALVSPLYVPAEGAALMAINASA